MQWQFSAKAKQSIRESTARINIWHGSVRSGKTISSLIRWITYVGREAPPGDLLMVGKTERTLKRNILGPLEEMVGSKHYHPNLGEGELTLFGRRVYLMGANDTRAEKKIRGMTVAGFYGDEITVWPENFYRQLLARMSITGAKGFGSTNPDAPQHYLKVGFIDREAELDLRAFHFVLADNPALDPAYVTALEAEYMPGTLWHRRFILGQWVLAEGAVFDMFDTSKHLITKVPRAAPSHWDVAIDYGTLNPFSAGLYASWDTPQDGLRALRLGTYWYDGRATGKQKTDAEYAREVIKWLATTTQPSIPWYRPPLHKLRYIILDPSAASFRNALRQELRKLPYHPGPSIRNARNNVLDGIRLHASMLSTGQYKLLDDPSNNSAVREYGGYVWDGAAQARGEDKPLKRNDHSMDETRYYLETLYRHSTPANAARQTALTMMGY